MKKLSKIVRAGAFERDAEYGTLLVAYQTSCTALEQAKAAHESSKKRFKKAMTTDSADAKSLFEMHTSVKKLRFFRKISLLEKLAAKHNLKAWLAEAFKNKKKSKGSGKTDTKQAAENGVVKKAVKAAKKTKPAAERTVPAELVVAVEMPAPNKPKRQVVPKKTA